MATSKLRTHVETLAARSRPPGSEQHAIALEYIERTLREEGWAPQRAPFEDGMGMNVFAARGAADAPLLLAAYDCEEDGLIGSAAHCLAVVANEASRALLDGFPRDPFVEAVAVSEDSVAGLMARLSDHGAFWEAGFPALLATDTAFLRNPHRGGLGPRPVVAPQ